MLIFSYIFKHELKMYFPRWYSFFVQFILSLSTLVFYWFFSKAMVASPALSGEMPEGYFIYLLTGELSLLWASIFVATPPKIIKQFYFKRALDNLIILKQKAFLVLTKMTLSQMVLQSLRYIIYGVAVFYFSSKITGFDLLNFLFIQILYLPMFMGLGYFAASIVVYYGRGEKIIQIFISASYVLAGVYFPVSVFPSLIKNIFSYSPFNVLINSSRRVLSGEDLANNFYLYLLLSFFVGMLLLVVSYKLFCYLIMYTDRKINHRPLIT